MRLTESQIRWNISIVVEFDAYCSSLEWKYVRRVCTIGSVMLCGILLDTADFNELNRKFYIYGVTILLTNRSHDANRYTVSEYVRGDETNITTVHYLPRKHLNFFASGAKTIENKKIFYIITYVLASTRIELRRFSSCKNTLVHTTRVLPILCI